MMEKVSSVSGLIGSLPKIRKRRIWIVQSNGKNIQAVSATDNRESTARKYIENKYPGMEFNLIFAEWR